MSEGSSKKVAHVANMHKRIVTDFMQRRNVVACRRKLKILIVAGQRLLWRVPVCLALPTTGPLGQVGTLDVDAQTDEILFTQQALEEIAERGIKKALSAALAG